MDLGVRQPPSCKTPYGPAKGLLRALLLPGPLGQWTLLLPAPPGTLGIAKRVLAYFPMCMFVWLPAARKAQDMQGLSATVCIRIKM